MNINLAQLTNDEIVTHVNERIAQYEKEKEQSKSTGYAIYNGVSLTEFQQFDKQLQRCLVYGTDGAIETRDKVKQILRDDAGIGDRPMNSINSLHDYYKRTGQAYSNFAVNR